MTKTMKKIILKKGQTTIVDNDDYEELNQFKWRLGTDGYASRGKRIDGKFTLILLHRVVNQTPAGLVTDHINRNKLDNRKCNLRSVTQSVNRYNTGLPANNKSGYKRLRWHKPSRRWAVEFLKKNSESVQIKIFCKSFKDKDEAINALLAAEKIHLDPEFWQQRLAETLVQPELQLF